MNDRIEIPESRKNRWFLFLLSFAFVVFCIWMYASNNDEAAAFSGVLFAIMSIVLFRWAMSPGARVVLDEYGIEDRTIGVGLIEWQDISGVSIGQVKGIVSINLHVKNEDEYLERLNPFRRYFAKLGVRMGYSAITIGIQGLKITPEELVKMIEERRRRT